MMQIVQDTKKTKPEEVILFLIQLNLCVTNVIT